MADPDSASGRRVVHFQEYWVRLRAAVPAETVLAVGQDAATPAPGVLEAIGEADLVVLPPSNPVVSVGTILGVPGIRDAVRATPAPVVGLSPIVGASHVHGMAAQMLTSIGVEVSAGAVGAHYGARSAGGVLDGWLVDERDAEQLAGLEQAGIRAAAVPLDDVRPRRHRGDGRGRRLARHRRTGMSNRLEVWAPDGMPEVVEGDDLAGLVLDSLQGDDGLADGDVLCVTSKVVSKAEGRVRAGDRDAAVEEETVRVVARRGPVTIVRNRLGLTMAAAGVDASNVAAGSVVLLPLDPDASARALRHEVHRRTGTNVGVVVTDTSGRAWREGQTDIAIGAAGLLVAEDFAGRTDPHGNALAVTLPAVADEIAGAAELAQGKLAGRPVAVVRGRADLVLPPGEDGPGAASLVRPDGGDLFGWGAREAVVRALAGDDADRAPFGAPAAADELHSAVARVVGAGRALSSALLLTFDDDPGRVVLHLPGDADHAAVAAVCFAHGWRIRGWERAGNDVVCDVSPATT